MDTKKINILIVAVFAIAFSYSLFWFLRSVFIYQYAFRFRFLSSYTPTLLGLTGLIIFITSKFKRSNLLRIYMCLVIISAPFSALFYIKIFQGANSPFLRPIAIPWTFYVSLFLYLSSLITSIVGLRTLSFNKRANLSFFNDENEHTAQFFPAPAGLRFANRLIDAVLILFVLWVNAPTILSYFQFGYSIPPQVYFLLEIPFLLFYYLVLEGIFNTTAGKCATNTTIVNMQGQRPSFVQILGRTFCRLIPFEAFSFLGESARGWHDSLTNTYVTDSINREDFEMNEFTLDAELNNNTNANYYSAG